MRHFLIVTLLLTICAPSWAYDIVVAKDGSGQFTNIQEAILSVRDYTPIPKTIFIKKGIYNEKVIVPANKCDITIIGESMDSTVIRWDDHANINKMGTFKTSTLRIDGQRIRLENLTVENNAPLLGQAVALHIEGHQVMVVNCKLLGNQDTLFTGNEYAVQVFKDCYIEGTVDFIFGPATVWFENCQINSKRNAWVTAASTPANKKYGYIFNKCRLTANEGVDKVFLGRPWRAYAAVLFMDCDLGSHICPEGWENWSKTEHEKTARYAEYNNRGAGADISKRAPWSKQLTKKEAKAVTISNVTSGWLNEL